MKTIHISKVGLIKLISYKPLCYNKIGLNAINTYQYPPFVDHSCRREPDFQNQLPTITSLCRSGKFAPFLKVDDIVIVITKQSHHLVAILQVIQVFQNHQQGYNWYLNNNLTIPGNCMIQGNPPLDFDRTAGDFINKTQENAFLKRPNPIQLKIGSKRLPIWDNLYIQRANNHQNFVSTKALYLDINNPKCIKQGLLSIFSKTPGTQNNKKLSLDQLEKIGKLVDINFSMEII